MKRWQYLIFALFLTVGLVACGGQSIAPTSQPEKAEVPQVETYTDEHGFFTAEYPVSWVVQPYGFGDEAPFPHVTFGSNQEIIDLSNAYEPLPEGETAVAVMILPREMFAEAGVTSGTPLDEVARLVLAGMADAPEEIEAVLAEATFESISLSNGSPAVRITSAVPTKAYVIHFADVGEGLYLFAPQVLAVDYENAELEGQVEAIVNSVKVTTSSKEVMGFIMGKMGAIEGTQ